MSADGQASEPTAAPLVELIDVSHSYHARRANFERGLHRVLDHVSLAVYPGETLAVIGRNGAGKSTLLRLMAGILAPSRGVIRRAADARCSLLSLGLGFQPQLTGRDNARLTALLQGASKAEADGHLEEVKAFSELGDSFEEPVKTYSAGMRARLGFSAALLINVEVLLIDEVLSVGDRYFRKKATAAMRERIGGRQTAVLVSHSTALLRNLCTRAICLDNGAISFDGDIEAAVDNYLH